METRDFKIIWVSHCSYSSGNGVSCHKHPFFHLIYVESGEGEIIINEKAYRMLPDNVYLIPPFTRHSFENCENRELKSIEIKFSVDDEGSIYCKLPLCMKVNDSPVKAILMTILKENADKLPMFSDVVSVNFELLMLHLLRCNPEHFNAQGYDIRKKDKSPEIDKAIEFIDNNLSEEISLTTLAEVAGFEKNYFSRKFKKQTNRTPMAFIKDKRIERAKELLIYSDMNISQIALETGFNTVHYFSNVFLEHTGKRPLEYRNGAI